MPSSSGPRWAIARSIDAQRSQRLARFPLSRSILRCRTWCSLWLRAQERRSALGCLTSRIPAYRRRKLTGRPLQRIAAGDALPAGAAHARQQLAVRGQPGDGARDRIAGREGHEQAVQAFDDDIRNGADPGDDRRHAGGHAFQQRVRQALAVAREDQCVRARQQRRLGRAEHRAGERDVLRDPALAGEALQARFLGPAAGNHQSRARTPPHARSSGPAAVRTAPSPSSGGPGTASRSVPGGSAASRTRLA